jgi:hypothetical protein
MRKKMTIGGGGIGLRLIFCEFLGWGEMGRRVFFK